MVLTVDLLCIDVLEIAEDYVNERPKCSLFVLNCLPLPSSIYDL